MVGWIIILLGMLIFAGLHTLSASQSFKQAIRKRVSERVYHGFYRAGYNLFSVITLLPVAFGLSMGEGIIWQIPESEQIFTTVLVIIQTIGTIGMIISLIQIDLLRFIGIKQIWAYFKGDILPLADEPLQRKGLYKIVRHPLYFFALLSIWFVPVMSDIQFLFTLTATAYFVIGSRWEEQRMVNSYGQDYIDYQQSVPWLIPFVNFR